MSIPVAILGASGYTGAELLRLLAAHPEFDVVAVTGDSCAGQAVAEVYPHIRRYGSLVFQTREAAQSSLEGVRVVFCAMPHGQSLAAVSTLDAPIIIDLSSDFRLKNPDDYMQWYGAPHGAPEQLAKWVYGLPELFRADVQGATRIANPGCFPTSVILALAPLLRAGCIAAPLTISSCSGTSGAGKTPKPGMHFSHVYEDVRAYKVASHQHTPEIEQALSVYSGVSAVVSFTPHLMPMSRGLHSCCVAQLCEGVAAARIQEVLHAAYDNEPFVHVIDEAPGTKSVRGTNCCALSATVDTRTNQVIVTSVIDNLVKGASGQAIQNANIACGLEEVLGLPTEGLYP